MMMMMMMMVMTDVPVPGHRQQMIGDRVPIVETTVDPGRRDTVLGLALARLQLVLGLGDAAFPDGRPRQHLLLQELQALEVDPYRPVPVKLTLAVYLVLLQLGAKCIPQTLPFRLQHRFCGWEENYFTGLFGSNL